MGCESEIRSVPNCAQNTQNPAGSSPGIGSADIAHTLGRVENLLTEIEGLGVVLSIESGSLAFDAPAGVLGDDTLARMRADRDGLLALVRAKSLGVVLDSEPTAIVPEATGDDGPGDGAARSSIACPWCGPVDLMDAPEGVRCSRCDRVAWLVDADGGIERADLAEIELVDPRDVPACSSCGGPCDTVGAMDGWACSRCQPERAKVTARVLAIRARWLRRGGPRGR